MTSALALVPAYSTPNASHYNTVCIVRWHLEQSYEQISINIQGNGWHYEKVLRVTYDEIAKM